MGDGYEQVKEQIQLLLRKLEELEVIEYGEGLYGVVIEKNDNIFAINRQARRASSHSYCKE